MGLVFDLPFCLLLPDGDYPVKLEDGSIVNFHLTKVTHKIFDERLPYRGLSDKELKNISELWIGGKKIPISELSKRKDFGIVTKYVTKRGKEVVPQLDKNDISFHEPGFGHPHYWGRQVVINAEVKRDCYGRFRYTNVNCTTDKPNRFKEEFARALKGLNQLLYIYRVETSDFWITNLAESDVLVYKSVNSKSQAYSIHGISKIKDDHDSQTVTDIKYALMNPSPEHPFMMLLLDSKKSLYENKFYLSVIYAITALESIIKLYIVVYVKKQKLGKKVEERLLSSSLNLLVTTILKMTLKSSQFTDDLVQELVNSIRLRNRIIHESQLEVDQDDAKLAIKNVSATARILIDEMTEYYGAEEQLGINSLNPNA